MKATFLLGSGISIPASLPSVEILTSAILSGDGLIMRLNRRVERIVNKLPEYKVNDERENMRHILILLDWLKAQANSRYAELQERWVNYEDLAYLAGQIRDDLVDEYENPALQPFVRNALIDLRGLFPDVAPSAARERLRELAGWAVDYIRQVVALLLSQRPSDTSYLQVFADACQDPLVSEVNLFTLNHDTLLEEFLRSKKINAMNGLRDTSNGDGSHRWDPSVFDNPNDERRVNLFKLHGSISWFRWEPRRGSSQDEASCKNADRNRRFVGTYTAQGPKTPLYEQVLENEGPHIRVGTFNKIFDYNSEIFLELHNRFHRALQDCKTLVVCGYGFGDKGVNTRIAEWRHQPSNPRLLIIDPAEPCKIYRKASGAIRREIPALCPKEVVDSIPPGPVEHWRNRLEDYSDNSVRIVTWERIRAVLHDR